MRVRVLPRATPSASNSNNSTASPLSLPASTTASPPSISIPSTCSSSSPPLSSAASADFQLPLSWPPPSPTSTSVDCPLPGPPCASSFASTSFSQGCGPTGANPASLLSPGAGGVVVVGVIGRVRHELSQLLDRLLDSHIFGVKSRVREEWQECVEGGSLSSDLANVTTMERKQMKDGHRNRGTDPHESGVLQSEGTFKTFAGLATNDSGQNCGSRSGKGHVKNVHYGRRNEDVEGVRSEKRHRETDDSKKVQFRIRSGIGEDNDSGKGRGGWKDSHWNVPGLPNKVNYHHDVEKGMVFLQFAWGVPPLDCLKEDSLKVAVATNGLFSILEHHEADDMRGLLFMFSVCHVILMVQDGASFDPHLLRIFRLLQTAKHSLAPFVKAHILPGLLPPPSFSLRPAPLKPVSIGTSQAVGKPGVGGSSTLPLISGSSLTLIPGQCTPVVLFVCLEDMAEQTGPPSLHSTTRAEDILERAPSAVYNVGSLSPSTNYLPRQNSHVRPASSGLALLRTNKKWETGMRKKLQAALEVQIRFLLKKCRTMGIGDTCPFGAGVGTGMGPRGPGNSGGGALFVLDPSRAVILMDRSPNWQTDATDAAIDGIEAMLSDKNGLEDLLWDLGSNFVMSGEDVQAVKDFLWRQADMLRGKGGISNTAVGGSAGVGMVAAAAAAAAASAASGFAGGSNKPISNPPELPTFSSWLSACRVLAEALSVRLADDCEQDIVRIISDGTQSVIRHGALSPTRMSRIFGSAVKSKAIIESSLSCLETGAHIDLKFSIAWCKRVLPSCLDFYLKGLPPSYPTSLHKFQLQKTLHVFNSMVRGPAVPLYADKLQKKCEAVWHSGRQLCDAVSLTGKPCIHQVHEVIGAVSKERVKDGSKSTSEGAPEEQISRPHSSGVVFLHACACGRSRKLRKDPFNFESANISFFRFPNCEDLLPSLVNPNFSGVPPSEDFPWSLVRLGSSRYYEPTVGLVQSGFIPDQNFLSLLDIPVLYNSGGALVDALVVGPPKEEVAELLSSGCVAAYVDPKVTSTSLVPGAQPVVSEPKLKDVDLYGKVNDKDYPDGTQSASSRGMSGNARKQFKDIAMKVNFCTKPTYPPSPEKQYRPLVDLARSDMQPSGKEKKRLFLDVRDNQIAIPMSLVDVITQKSHHALGFLYDAQETYASNAMGQPRFSSNMSLKSVTKPVQLYIGFEHECPHGHRFLLSKGQPERSSSSESSVSDGSKQKKMDRVESLAKQSLSLTGKSAMQETLKNLTVTSLNCLLNQTQKGTKIPEDLHYWSVQDGHSAGHSLLNSNLPIYMHCPYCKISEDENLDKRVAFGGTISQLQRVFLVTPPLPLRLASCPVVQFEDVSKPVKTTMEFNPGSELVLPPDSFLSLRLPFVYYSQLGGAPKMPLFVNQDQPEHCAWLVKNTAVYVLSN